MKPEDVMTFHSATALPRYAKRNGRRCTLLYPAAHAKDGWIVLFEATDKLEPFA